jgi:hypothetical protein
MSTASVIPIAATGIALVVVVLSPSWPKILEPQHASAPLVRRTHVCWALVSSSCAQRFSQTPRVHGDPNEQTLPQRPQLVAELAVAVSQPFAVLMSQLEKPGLHAVMPQTPAVQLPIALAGAHVRPQAPQCAVDREVSASQPFAAIVSQLAKPGLHTPTLHVPIVHTAVALEGAHSLPHAPQCVSELVSDVSQPLVALPSQSPKPALHAPIRHVPPTHEVVALGRLQARPQAPQCAAVVLRSVSQPLAALPSQLPRPIAQVVVPQTPIVHAGVPVIEEHALPQVRQCATELLRSASQPLALFVSQLPKPALQLRSVHVPIVHAESALARLHERPQAPQ